MIGISVIIPTYNRADSIGHTLERILQQDHRALEVIVVNDGSTDNTISVVEAYGPAVKLLNIDNVGCTGAKSVGVAAAKGDWLAFCDSDDVWDPNHLSGLAELAITHNVAYAFSNFTHVNDGQRAERSHFEADPAGFWMKPGLQVAPDLFLTEAPLFLQILRYQAMFASCTFVKRSVYNRIGGFNAFFGRNPSEDFEFNLRCTKETSAGVIVRPTVEVHRHGQNMSGDWIRTIAGSIAILQYARDQHDLCPDYRAAVEREIMSRSIYGIDCCFAQRRFEDVRLFTGNLPNSAIDLKTAIKIAVSRQPKRVALACRTALELASAGARVWRSLRNPRAAA